MHNDSKTVPSCNPPPVPIIVGAPRSGSTLLRLMLDAHSQLAIPPETGFLGIAFGKKPVVHRTFFEKVTQFPRDAPAWGDYGVSSKSFWEQLQRIDPFDVAEGFRCFYWLYTARQGKSRWGDKTPGHVFGMPLIEQRIPEVRFIHLIRDGRDVALSWKPWWFSPSQSIAELAQHWMHWVETGRRHGAHRQHYMEVRFEELVTAPERVLKSICNFLSLDFEPAMLSFHDRALQRLSEHAARRAITGEIVVTQEQRLLQQALTMQPVEPRRAFSWKQAMSVSDQKAFATVAGSLLTQLNYST